MPGITKGWKITGGPPSNAAQLAYGGQVNAIYNTLGAKSKDISEIPRKQLALDAELEVAKQQAETLKEKAHWDSKTLGAKFDAEIGGINSAANSNLLSGALRGGMGLGLSAFKLFSGKQGGDGTGDDTGTSLVSGLNGTSWDDMSKFTSGFDLNSSGLGGSYNPFG